MEGAYPTLGLTDKLVSADAVAVAVRAYAEETNRQNHERRAQSEADCRSLEKINRGMKGILDAIEDGMYQPAMKARMNELEQQKTEIEKRLEAIRPIYRTCIRISQNTTAPR